MPIYPRTTPMRSGEVMVARTGLQPPQALFPKAPAWSLRQRRVEGALVPQDRVGDRQQFPGHRLMPVKYGSRASLPGFLFTFSFVNRQWLDDVHRLGKR